MKKICVICELKIGGRRESQICVTLRIVCGSGTNMLTRKRLYNRSFLEDSGKRSERSRRRLVRRTWGYHIEYGYPVAFVGYP